MTRRLPRPYLVVSCLGLLALSGCDSARSAFGFERTAPDEFAVVSRQPLSIPPDFRLRPPEPGAPRPREASTRALTEALVLGSGSPGTDPTGTDPTGTDPTGTDLAGTDPTGVGPAPQAIITAGPGVSPGENALLARSGADQAAPDIRQIVDRETADLIAADEGFADVLIFWREEAPPGTVLDPSEEARLLRESSRTGTDIRESEIPVIERRDSTILDSIF